jgi:hypothetical protein
MAQIFEDSDSELYECGTQADLGETTDEWTWKLPENKPTFSWKLPSLSQTIDVNKMDEMDIDISIILPDPILSKPIISASTILDTTILQTLQPLETTDSFVQELFFSTKKRKLSETTASSISTPISNQTTKVTETTPSEQPKASPEKKRALPTWMSKDTKTVKSKPTLRQKLLKSMPATKKVQFSSFQNERILFQNEKIPIRLAITNLESSKTAIYIVSFDQEAKYATCCPPLPEGQSDWAAGGVKRTVTFHTTIYSAVDAVVDSLGELSKKVWTKQNMNFGIFSDIGTLVKGFNKKENLIDILSSLKKQNKF